MYQRDEGGRGPALHAGDGGCGACLYPRTLDATHEGVWVTHALSGETIYANASFTRLFGASGAALSAPTLLSLVHDDDRTRVRAALEAPPCAATIPRFRVQSPSAGVRWVELRRFPIEDCVPARTAHVALDVTDHVLRETESHRQRELEAGLLETVHAAVAVVDLDGRVVRMNRFLEELSGVTLAAARGHELARILCREADTPRMRALVERTRAGERVRGEVVRIVAGDGGEHDIEWHSTVLHALEGEPTGILVTGHDITARLAAELALREREALLRQISDTIGEVFWLVSVDRRRLFYISAAVESVFGVTEEQMYADPTCFGAFIHPDERAALLARLAEQASSPPTQPYQHELRFLARDGSIRWVWNRVFPVRDEDGEVRRLVGISADITRRKEAEAQLAELTATLESRVETRTRELTVANATLAAEMREKEVLLREVHHRVKNNMQVISSLIYLRSRGVVEPAALAMLEQINARIRAMSLAHEVLYRSRDLAAVDAGTYVEAVVRSVADAYRDQATFVRVETAIDAMRLDLDVGLPCGLIVTELVSNAFKHAFRGRTEGVVLVSLRADDASGALLIVEDDGVGMPATPGTSGLGMQLVKTLARQVHGELVIATSSKGTRAMVRCEGVRRAAP